MKWLTTWFWYVFKCNFRQFTFPWLWLDVDHCSRSAVQCWRSLQIDKKSWKFVYFPANPHKDLHLTSFSLFFSFPQNDRNQNNQVIHFYHNKPAVDVLFLHLKIHFWKLPKTVLFFSAVQNSVNLTNFFPNSDVKQVTKSWSNVESGKQLVFLKDFEQNIFFVV